MASAELMAVLDIRDPKELSACRHVALAEELADLKDEEEKGE